MEKEEIFLKRMVELEQIIDDNQKQYEKTPTRHLDNKIMYLRDLLELNKTIYRQLKTDRFH